MADQYDLGNREAARPIFLGRYAVTPNTGVTLSNDTVMLTIHNIVCMTSNATLGTSLVVGTLPSECCPDTTMHIAAVLSDTTSTSGIQQSVIPVQITKDGNISIGMSYPGSVLHLDGVCFNRLGSIYKPLEVPS